MNTMSGSAHSKHAGLLAIEPSDEFVRPVNLKEDQSPNRRASVGKRALRALAQFLVTSCVFLAAFLAWQSYGNIARQVTAEYLQLGWLGLISQKVANATAVGAPDPVQQQLDADRSASGQEQMTRETDQTATSITQAASAQTDDIVAESQADGAPSQPMMRLNTKPPEGRSPQTLSEKGKQQLSAASRSESSCFPSASAVVRNHRGGWPTWTLRVPGHEGTLCWYAAERPRGSDHRSRASAHQSEMMPRKEIVGTTENGLSTQPTRTDSWAGELP
jgi:hypothetical protein